jgi:hypothetical protein
MPPDEQGWLGLLPPNGTLPHVPAGLLRLQAEQVPAQAVLQQTPSAQ